METIKKLMLASLLASIFIGLASCNKNSGEFELHSAQDKQIAVENIKTVYQENIFDTKVESSATKGVVKWIDNDRLLVSMPTRNSEGRLRSIYGVYDTKSQEILKVEGNVNGAGSYVCSHDNVHFFNIIGRRHPQEAIPLRLSVDKGKYSFLSADDYFEKKIRGKTNNICLFVKRPLSNQGPFFSQ